MKRTVFCFLFLFGLSTIGYCGQLSKIELTDGSIIQGEVVSFVNGIYTLNTNSFGQLKVDAAKIRKIESPGPYSPPAAEIDSLPMANVNSQMDSVKNQIVNNPEISKTVAGLVADPQFQEILKDPEIVKAVNSKDIKALMSNEKFMGLVNNPKVQEIKDKLKPQP